MQKEDLLKRIRLFATLTTVAFAVLIVTLLIQFGFITYYRSEIKQMQQENAQMREEIKVIKLTTLMAQVKTISFKVTYAKDNQRATERANSSWST